MITLQASILCAHRHHDDNDDEYEKCHDDDDDDYDDDDVMLKYLKQTLGSFSGSHDDGCHQT